MKYLLSIYMDESGWDNATPEDVQQTMDAYEAFGREVHGKGIYLAGEGLQPTSTATTVRVRDDERLVTDGPFAETKEQLGGFILINARDLNDAIQVASKIPPARLGSVEVRPIWELNQQ